MQPNITGWRRYFLVETPIVLYLLALAMAGGVTTDFMIFRSCQVILGNQKNACDVLHSNSTSKAAMDLEKSVQPHASYILMYQSFVTGIVPALLSFFLGPWSDRYGRKPLLLAGYAGSAMSFFLWSILCTMSIDPWFYLLASIPPALVGGFGSIILGTMCFITDTNKNTEQSWHFTWLQATITGGLVVGSFSGPLVFKYFGYAAVFGTACACSSIATLFVLFFVPESVVRIDGERGCCSLFDVSLVKDMFLTCTKKRDGFNRTIAWCCIIYISINLLIMEGDSVIGFLFASARFGWDINDFGTYQAIFMLLSIVGTLLGAKIIKTFLDPTLTNIGIAICAITCMFVSSMGKSLTTKPWHLYLSSVPTMFGGLAAPVVRAAMAKCAPPEDTGKLFSFTTSMEMIMPLVASPLYTMIYTHNMPPIYPSPAYLASAAFQVANLIIVIIIDRQISKSTNSRCFEIDNDRNVD